MVNSSLDIAQYFQSDQGSNSSSNSHHAPWLEASAPFEEGLPGFDTPKPNRRMGCEYNNTFGQHVMVTAPALD